MIVLRKAISVFIEIMMKKGFFSFHTDLWALARQKLCIIILADQSNSDRQRNLLLIKTVCVLNFIIRKVACCSTMYMYLTYNVMSARFDTKPRREAISLKIKLLCLLCNMWCSMYSRAMCLSSRMPMVSYQILIKMPSCLWTYKQLLSVYFVIDKGLICRLVSGLPKIVNNTSVLVAKAGQRLSQMSASKLLLMNIAFFFKSLSSIQEDFQVKVVSSCRDQEFQVFIQFLQNPDKVKKSVMFLDKKLNVSY